jgi:hypothetical protein
VDAERALVSSLVVNGKGLEEVDAANIRTRHFYDDDCARVLSYIRAYSAEHGKQPPSRTVLENFPEFNLELRDDPISFLIERFVQNIERRLADDFTYELARAITDPGQNGKLAELIIEQGFEIASSLPLAEGEDENPADSWGARVILGDDEAPEPTILGVVYPGHRHIFSGEPESLKTWAALACCAEEIRAERNVVFLDFDEGGKADIKRRLTALGLSDEQISKQFYFVAPEAPITTPGAQERLHELLDVMEPSLVVVDASAGALELHGLDENRTQDIQTFQRLIVKPLRIGGAGVIVIDHVTKNPDSRGKHPIGSQRKLGATDVHLSFETIRPFGIGRHGVAEIFTHKDRPAHLPRPYLGSLHLKSNAATGAVSYDLTIERSGERPFRPTKLMERASRFLEENGEQSTNKVVRTVSGKNEAIETALEILYREGFINRSKGTRNSTVWVSVKPFREDEDEGESGSEIFVKSSREEGQ